MSVFDDAMEEQLDLAFETFGAPGKWQYQDALIRRFHNDRELMAAGTGILAEANILKVRVKEVPCPAIDDLVEVGGQLLRIIAPPQRLDRRGRVWTCEATETVSR
ncbi:MAG: hypothetical protein NVV72_01070 [Asticcacaulis sp.]|nr:hypothetical protein [Asticcacaulis sp.]